MNKMKKLWCLIAAVAAIVAIAVFGVACAPAEQPAPPAQYTVTFKIGDGQSAYETVTGAAGSELVRTKPDPTRAGYVFDGWSLTQGGEVVTLPATIPESDVTYYAVFSKHFGVTLDAGVGTYDGATHFQFGVGKNLYDIIKDITPTAPGKSKFDGWYYNGVKLDASSTATLPEEAVTLVARYTVSYTLVTKKETALDSDNYGSMVDTLIDKGFVGSAPDGSKFPVYDGYELVPASFILSATGDNDFTAYYKVRAVTVAFDANAPDGKTADGEVKPVRKGYGEEFDLPACYYAVEGHRFMYWAKNPDGTGKVSGKFDTKSDTTLYAVWLQGCADAFGASEDYIFIDRSGDTVKAYLMRLGLEIEGEFDDATKVFTFKNKDNTILAHGVADEKNHTFAYYTAAEYKLRVRSESDMYGTLDGNVTLTLSDNGTAVYKAGEAAPITGKYTINDAKEGGVLFTPTDPEVKGFTFKLSVYRDATGNESNAFEIRGEETGVWLKYANGAPDYYYMLYLDGFGSTEMIVALGEKEQTVYAGSYCVIDDNEYYAVFAVENKAFEMRFTVGVVGKEEDAMPVFIEYDSVTALYANSDKTGAKFELDGYGMHAVKVAADGTRTEGAYSIDTADLIFMFKANDGDAESYFLTVNKTGEGDNAETYFTFEAKQDKPELNGRYLVTGEGFDPRQVYYYRFYNDNVVRLFVSLPYTDGFGVLDMKFSVVAEGEYEKLADGEFAVKAEVDENDAMLVYYIYYTLFGQENALDISRYGYFKCTLDTEKTTGTVIALGDGLGGNKFVLNGTEYTLDGYGTAVSADEKTRTYSFGKSAGTLCVFVDGDTAANEEKENIFVKLPDEENLLRVAVQYYKHNATNDSYVILALLDGTNKAALLRVDDVTSAGTPILAFYSYGTVAWSDADKTQGVYSELGLFDQSGKLLSDRYGDTFSFGICEFIDKETQQPYKQLVIYPDANENSFAVTSGTVTLYFDLSNATVKYEKDGVIVMEKGDFVARKDYVTVSGFNPNTGKRDTVTFKLVKDGNGVITSFTEVSAEAGEWMESPDGDDRLVLSGVDNGNGTFNGTLKKYDAETETFVDYNGTYKHNVNDKGEDLGDFVFTYNDGTAEVELRFALGFYGSVGFPIYREYVEYIGNDPLYLYTEFGASGAAATLLGGGYGDLVLKTSDSYTTGVLNAIEIGEGDAKSIVWEFVSDDITLYFVMLSDGTTSRAVLLDGTFTKETLGEFECEKPIDIKVPSGSNVVTITVKKLVFNGWGGVKAVLTNDTSRNLYYVAQSDIDFVLCDTLSGQLVIVANFRLYVVTPDAESGQSETKYVVRFIDSRLIDEKSGSLNIYLSVKGELFTTDGYDTALFVDDKGVMYSGEFEWVDGRDNVLKLTYYDEGRAITVYVTLNKDGSFEMTSELPELPEPTADGN